MSYLNLRIRSAFPDVLQILLCTYMTHVLAMRPLTGAAVYAMYLIERAAVAARRSGVRAKRYVGALFFACGVMGPVFLVVYPMSGDCWVGSGLCVLTVLRTAVSDASQKRTVRGAVQLGFFAVFALVARRVFYRGAFAVAITVFAASGAMLVFRKESDEGLSRESTMDGIESYALFSKMAFLVYLSGFMGLVFFACYISMTGTTSYVTLYASMLLWFFLVCMLSELFHRCFAKRGSHAERISWFLFGALLTAFGYYRLFESIDPIGVLLYSALWAFGFAAINAVIGRLNEDYALVARLDGRDVSQGALDKNIRYLSDTALAVAGVLFLAASTAYYAFAPAESYGATGLVIAFIRFLPLCALAVSVGFALKQPIDERGRQRLLVFFSRKDSKEATRLRMRELFVTKYRVRIGAKLLTYLLRPFLRHRVIGKKNIDPLRFPSVFVCNHGSIYGPVAAVMYLPVYFRPWSDDRMVTRELIEEHMYEGTFRKWPFGKWLARVFSGPVIWAITSFEPIAVSRSNMKGLIKTMEDTVKAMTESDNVLIFPEDPSQRDDGRYANDEIGPFFSGFVSIGKLYYEATGTEALFYPVVANRKRRTLTIGKPICYDSKSAARDERKRLSSALHDAMSDMLSGKEET